ncbi:hypothetical protein CL631_00370 [bacterium]|nr:hypothetical protein [bacterium]MDP6659866.1 hypothetical protein [Candidatus Paceibacterota bacterium]
MNWLRNPKFLAAVFVIVLVVGVLILNRPAREKSEIVIGTSDTKGAAVKIVQKDTDSDGLKDWEESLIGTDPEKRDTDDDGVSDKEEVDSDRDPLVVGEGSVLASKSVAEEADSQLESISDVDKLSREFLEGYIDLKKRGYIGTGFEDRFIEDLFENNFSLDYEDKYNENELAIRDDSSRESAKTYREDVESAIEKIFTIKEDELAAFAIFVENGDLKERQKLEESLTIYKEVLENLLLVSVPRDAVSVHLGLVNSFDFLSNTVSQMIGGSSDPIKSFTAVSGYQQSEADLKSAFSRLNTYFLSKGV